jgi:hypothetical protein
MKCPKCNGTDLVIILSGPYTISASYINEEGEFDPEDAEPAYWPSYFKPKEVHCSCGHQGDVQEFGCSEVKATG